MKEKNSWNVEKYNKHTSFVSKLAMPVLDLLGDIKDKKILDVGCGEGTLAKEIAQRGAKVIGIDLSQEMVNATKAKGIEAYFCSVTALPYESEFDAVFSNAVLHWVQEAKEAVVNINKALKQDGVFVAEFGGDGNIKSIVNAMREVFKNHKEYGEFKNIWYFPSDKEYKKLLEESGFRVEYIELIKRPTPIDDIVNWLDVFTNGFTKHLSQTQVKSFRKEVREFLKTTNYTIKNGWIADYVRLRVKAVKV